MLSVLQFDELKDQVAVEQILRVVFLDVERPSPVRIVGWFYVDSRFYVFICLWTFLMNLSRSERMPIYEIFCSF